jgi:hypothetical protein
MRNQPDSFFHAVKEPWKQFEWRIILSFSFDAVCGPVHSWVDFLPSLQILHHLMVVLTAMTA